MTHKEAREYAYMCMIKMYKTPKDTIDLLVENGYPEEDAKELVGDFSKLIETKEHQQEDMRIEKYNNSTKWIIVGIFTLVLGSILSYGGDYVGIYWYDIPIGFVMVFFGIGALLKGMFDKYNL